jgi:transcriptional regulator with XRE-family HTH domain
MDLRSEIRAFLTSRRAKITSQQAGLPVFGNTRRVPGLRREEAAMLAGVSVDYYTKMERGNLRGVSPQVLDALARGLQLNHAEHTHLLDLARAAGPTPTARPRPARLRVDHGLPRVTPRRTVISPIFRERPEHAVKRLPSERWGLSQASHQAICGAVVAVKK